eukprot:344633_1
MRVNELLIRYLNAIQLVDDSIDSSSLSRIVYVFAAVNQITVHKKKVSNERGAHRQYQMNDAIRKSIRYPQRCTYEDTSCKFGDDCHWVHKSDLNDKISMEKIESECAKRKDNWYHHGRDIHRGRGWHQSYQMNRNNDNNNDNNSAQNVSQILDFQDGHSQNDSPNEMSYMMRQTSPTSSSNPKATKPQSNKNNKPNNSRIINEPLRYDIKSKLYRGLTNNQIPKIDEIVCLNTCGGNANKPVINKMKSLADSGSTLNTIMRELATKIRNKYGITIHNNGRRLEVENAHEGMAIFSGDKSKVIRSVDDLRKHCRIGCLAGDLWTEATRGSVDKDDTKSPGDNNADHRASKQLK